MGERGFGIRSGPNKQSWEEADAPIVCESCLGENPYVRMLKSPAHKECKICARPFTNFRWKSGPKGRFKNTEVCQTCARIKNVCQTCILDLTFHLPVEVRDRYLADQQVMIPTQEANKNFYIDQANRSLDSLALPYEQLESNQTLAEIARNRAKPYYARNLPQICSFFVKGNCNRGDECPYRHELPTEKHDPELANQNIVDRFHGKNDPVANKILNKVNESDKVKPPADQSIATLFLNDLPLSLTEDDLIDIFKTYGDVDEVRIFPSGKQALVSFLQRSACEKAIGELYGKLVMKGQSVQVRWARPEKERKVEQVPKDPSLFVPHNIPSMIKAPVQSNPNIRPPTMPPPDMNMGQINKNKFIENIAQIGNPTYYPSMDPNAMGGMRQNRPGYTHKQ